MLEAGWQVFCPNEVRAKNINAHEAKTKQSIEVCVASVASIHKLARGHESPRQKILSGKAVKNSKEPVWLGNFSSTEPDKICNLRSTLIYLTKYAGVRTLFFAINNECFA